jgi:hypothetical protein
MEKTNTVKARNFTGDFMATLLSRQGLEGNQIQPRGASPGR